ncbi:hypothetical protein N7D90_24575 (plasmid) [Pseudomonas fragi]|uniref:hypothetical protein n=1 Tax=Pseudomonas fragi TaxID=296 RepID=UPI0021C0FC7A|nr:hypothetical protein [Pseudomonas fragi]UXL41037.1 hypothetical protein N7D90_24575 [Pseudomonas fragi]
MSRNSNRKHTKADRFNIDEIRKNAVSSIQLGVEDFVISRDTPGKTTRALSAARNIYAGVLLLFKYKIASLAKTPEQAQALIYKPASVLPFITDTGNISWSPTLHDKETINTGMIKARLESLGVNHDWKAILTLRDCRNALEHLHPTDPISSIQASIAALFPMLSRFITEELGETPAALLGDAWPTMLATHDFFKECQIQVENAWTAIEYPNPAMNFLRECCCRACYSSLLGPLQEDVDNQVSIDTTDFRLQCFACSKTESAIEFLEDNFSDVHEDPFEQAEPRTVQECSACSARMYLITDSTCHWCGYETVWPKCAGCEKPITEYVANEGGRLCDQCAEDEWLEQRR